MADRTSRKSEKDTLQEVRDAHGYGAASELQAQRTLDSTAAFLLPHLTPGMSLPDCGFGPGNVTVSLAEVLAPASTCRYKLKTKN